MALFETGAQFPPQDSIERLSKYKRMRKLFDGKQWEVYERASEILKEGSPEQADQLRKLYIAVNLADILTTKPADLLVGEPPQYESGLPDNSPQQKKINSYVEENDLNKLIHESAVGNGFRGDAWIKNRYDYRQDFSEVLALEGGSIPDNVNMEPIIEHVNASNVFPEISKGNAKRFKAVNLANVEWVIGRDEEVPFLVVERHIPGYIMYQRFRLHENDVINTYGVPIQLFDIGEQVATGKDEDIIPTGVNHMLVHHAPYKSIDDTWEGIGGLEKIESVFAALNDRLVQLDFVLWKLSDPTAYGPDLESAGGNTTRLAGAYIPVTKDDVPPGYMTWDARLEQCFKQIELLLGIIFQMSETPQWLFGTTMSGDNSGGSGTSHTDGAAIKARFMPILSKVKRIRVHYDKAIRDALWTAQLLDIEHGEEDFEPVYPTINWKDGIPKNQKEEAEIAQLRTGGKATIDVKSAIKRQDEVDDEKAAEIMNRIEEDEKTAAGFVEPSIFNEES